MSDTNCDEVLFERRGHAGIITLNRPKALNALTQEMVDAIKTKLTEWADDAAVAIIVQRGAGERAFCAGGDIRKIYDMGPTGDPRQTAFFRGEYQLNALIKHYPKPFVSLIDGILMGGGVGLSAHGRYCVGGENTVFAMPEVGIGFFPDVGASYLLPRLRTPHLGMFCAMTGARLKQADALWAGLLTHTARGADFDAITQALANGEDPDVVLSRYAVTLEGASEIAQRAETIDACFSRDSALEILAALQGVEGADAEWAQKTVAAIRGRSPTSVALSFRELREGAKRDFDDCMRMEYRIVNHILKGHDFFEGVRAVIVDKDNAPKWLPARLEEVDKTAIDAHFLPPQGGDLVLA